MSGSSVQSNKAWDRNKRYITLGNETKLTLFAGGRIIYKEMLENWGDNLLDRIHLKKVVVF